VATPIAMPKLGMSMQEGRVVAWPLPLGARVERGQTVVVIESEKAEVEIEATASGLLRHLYVAVDETVPCGTLLGAITETASEPFDAEAFRAAHDRPIAAAAPAREAAKRAPTAETAPHKMLRRCMTLSLYAEQWLAASLSLAPHLRQFLAVGHQRGAFADVDTVEPEHLVVSAADECVAQFLVRLAVLPDAYPFDPDDRGFVVLRYRHVDPAAIAVDAAAEAYFMTPIVGREVVA